MRMLRGEEDGPRLTRWAAPGADRVGSRDSGRYSFERSLTHNSLPPDSDSFYFFSRSLDPKLGGFCFGTDSGFLEQTNQAESFRDRWVRSSFAQRPVSERVSPKPHLTHLGYGIAWRSHFSWWTKKKTPITTKWMNRTATFEGSVPGQTGEAKLPPVRGNKHTHTHKQGISRHNCWVMVGTVYYITHIYIYRHISQSRVVWVFLIDPLRGFSSLELG